jgi:hypothetical protein
VFCLHRNHHPDSKFHAEFVFLICFCVSRIFLVLHPYRHVESMPCFFVMLYFSYVLSIVSSLLPLVFRQIQGLNLLPRGGKCNKVACHLAICLLFHSTVVSLLLVSSFFPAVSCFVLHFSFYPSPFGLFSFSPSVYVSPLLLLRFVCLALRFLVSLRSLEVLSLSC